MKKFIPRYNQNQILSDLQTKMVLLSGPRQVGKTTLARQIKGAYYLNWDIPEHRESIQLVGRNWAGKIQKDFPYYLNLVDFQNLSLNKTSSFTKGGFEIIEQGSFERIW